MSRNPQIISKTGKPVEITTVQKSRKQKKMHLENQRSRKTNQIAHPQLKLT